MIPWTLYNGTSSLTSNNHFLEMIHWKKWVSVGFVMSSSEILSLFLDEKVISFLVTEINRYAEQKLFQRLWNDRSLARLKNSIEIYHFRRNYNIYCIDDDLNESSTNSAH